MLTGITAEAFAWIQTGRRSSVAHGHTLHDKLTNFSLKSCIYYNLNKSEKGYNTASVSNIKYRGLFFVIKFNDE